MSDLKAWFAAAKAAKLEQIKRKSQRERDQRERPRQEATRSERRALKAQERMALFGIEEPTDLETDGHRIIIEENTDVTAGRNKERQTRVLTLADVLHRQEKITSGQHQAADRLRELIMALLPGSEGVSSYGLSPGRTDPTTKAARRGRALTGYEINELTGDVKLGERRNRTERREAADLLYAMVGVCTEEGRKKFDLELATLLVRSVIEASRIVTLRVISAARTAYTGPKQLPPAGLAILRELYQRGAIYLGLEKGTDWRDNLDWIPY